MPMQRPDWERAYDRIWQRSRPLVLEGRHEIDVPPHDGGRWGISYVLRPDPGMAAKLAGLAREAGAVIGAPRSGWAHDADVLHITVRATEWHRTWIPEDDAQVRGCTAVLHEVARSSAPVTLELTTVALAPIAVLVGGVPLDNAAEDLRARLEPALAEHGVHDLEAGTTRDLWHLSLAQFTGPIADPEALVEWVGERRRIGLGTTTVTRLDLVRFTFDGRTIRMHTLASAPLLAGPS